MNHIVEKNLPTWKINDPTKISSFISCPRKYFFEYVLGWRPEVPSNHLVFGSAWHIAVEHLMITDYSPNSVVAAHDLFLKDYRQTFGPEQDDLFTPKTPDNAFIALGLYAKEFRNDLQDWEPLHTEISFRVSLNEDQVIHGRMDSILKHRQKERVKSIEQKTGSWSYNWDQQWPLSMQNGAYNHLMCCLFPIDIVDGVVFRGTIFRKVKKGWEQLAAGQKLTVQSPVEFLEFPARRTEEQMNSWLWHVQLYIDQISFCFEMLGECKEDDAVMTTFPQNPTSCTKYNGCEYLDYCNAWPNPLQRCHQPPIGFREDHWNPMAKPAKKTFEIGGPENV